MKSARLNQKNVLIGLVVLLAVSSMLPATWADRLSYAPRGLVSFFVNPLTDLALRLGPRRPPDQPVNVPVGPAEYLKLKRLYETTYLSLQEAARRLADYELLDEHALQYQLNLKEVGRITAQVTRSYDHQLTVSRGASRGLQRGLIAVDGPHLVGQIVELTAVSATVQLITRPGTTLEVHIIPPGAPGSDPQRPDAETWLQLRAGDDGQTLSSQCTMLDPVQPGDLAVLADNSWPTVSRGFIVGVVRSVESDPADPTNYRRVTVVPIRPLPYLDHVLILVPTQAN